MSAGADNDIDALFERHTIKEIEEILRNMRLDIERKKEDLRIMVGERYRDLIEAADTIASMQESAHSVYKNIGAMESLCQCLQQRGLIGFKTATTPKSKENILNNDKNQQYALAVQIKLLVDIPEILWSLTEKQEFLDAAQLFLLSKHVHMKHRYSFQASQEKFPVVSRQWASIVQFQSVLSRACNSVLQKERHDCKVVAKALASLFLIENKPLIDCLKSFLDLRKANSLLILNQHHSSVAKSLLNEFVIYFTASLYLLFNTFYGSTNEPCQLERLISGISESSETSYPPFALLKESNPGLCFLSKDILEFRVKPKSSFKTCDKESFQSLVEDWKLSICEESAVPVSNLLSCTPSLKSLANIRRSVWETYITCSSKPEWTNVLMELTSKQNFSPWDFIVRNEAVSRGHQIIKKDLESLHSSLQQLMNEFVAEIHSSSKVSQEELNICDFLWSESASDLPDQASWISSSSSILHSSNPDKMGLFYKSRGFTKRIQNICRILNSKLKHIVDDVCVYGDSSFLLNSIAESKPLKLQHPQEWTPSEVDVVHCEEDFGKLLRFLEQETLSTFHSFIENMKKVGLEESEALDTSFDSFFKSINESHERSFPPEDLDSHLRAPEGAILVSLARLSLAIPSVCSQLMACCAASALVSYDKNKLFSTVRLSEPSDTWKDLSSSFKDANYFLSNLFLKSHSKLCSSLLRKELTTIVSSNVFYDHLPLFSTWEDVESKDKNIEGLIKVESTIRGPAHLSLPLSKALFRICCSLNSVCPHTLSKFSHSNFISLFCSDVIAAYEEAVANRVKLVTQNASLQFIFDLKFVHNMLLLPQNREEIQDRSLKVIKCLEKNVDPFDLEVLHLDENVQNASQMLHILMGCLIPRGKQFTLTRPGTSSTSNSNTLPVVPSVEIPRFPNVPVPVSLPLQKKASSHSSTSVGFDRSNSDSNAKKQGKNNFGIEGGSSVLGSSLFSVMSSSWLGEYLNS